MTTGKDQHKVADGDGHGGNFESCPMPPKTVPNEELDSTFQGAMYALKREREQATVVDIQGNEVLIWLGQYDLHEYNERWDDPTAELYILVDQQFANSDPHWVMMVPAVTVDGNEPGKVPSRNTFTDADGNHGDKVEMVTEAAEEDSAIAFSWRWSNMNRQPDSARDLSDAHGLVEHLLRLGDSRGGV
jgi:hypothetical protein